MTNKMAQSLVNLLANRSGGSGGGGGDGGSSGGGVFQIGVVFPDNIPSFEEGTTLNKTFAEIAAAFEAGQAPWIVYASGTTTNYIPVQTMKGSPSGNCDLSFYTSSGEQTFEASSPTGTLTLAGLI